MTQTFESGYASTLSQKFSSTDTIMYVATPPTVTSGRIYLTDGSQKERVQFTGVSGSTLTGCVRGLSKTADPSTAGTGLNRLAGNPVVLVAMHDQLRDKNQATEALIYGKTYATTAARDAALGANGAAIHPYTNVYVTATGLHYNYNLSTAQREPASNGVATPNGTTAAAGKFEKATVAEAMTRTQTGGTGADLVITPDDMNVVTGTALQDLTAGKAVCMFNGGNVIKTIRRFAASGSTGTTGTGNSATQRMLYTLNVGYTQIHVYKKTADNKIYARVVDFVSTFTRIADFDNPTLGTEYTVTADALEAADGFCASGDRNYGSTFVVTYKKASDDKPYAVVCTVSGTVITAGTPVKIYDTEILQSGTWPTCAMVSNDKFVTGIHNDVSDDARVITCTIAGTVPTVTQDTLVEAVTMNASGQVLVCRLNNSGASVFYDDGTNIKMGIISQNGAVSETPVSLYAGYVSGADLCISLDTGYNEAFETLFFKPEIAQVRVSRIRTPNSVTMDNSYRDTNGDMYIPTRTSNLVNFAITKAGDQYRQNVGVGDGADVGFISGEDYSGGYGFNMKIYKVGTNSMEMKFQEKLYVYDSTAPLGVAMCNMSGSYTQPQLGVAYISTTSTTLYHSMRYSTEQRYIGIVKTTTLSGGTVPIITSGPAYVPGVSAGDICNLADAGALYYNGTKQVGMGIATDRVCLR